MEHPARDSLCRPRLVMSLGCAAALFSLGFVLSAGPQQAFTLPGVPTVTLPTISTPTVPAAAPGGPASVATSSASTTPASPRSTPHLTGAKRLRSGAIWIPISSVRAPVRLRLVVRFVRSARTASVRTQVIDTRGFVIRGDRVSMRSVPVRALVPTKGKLSAADGIAVLPVHLRKTTCLCTVAALTTRAVDPAAPALADASSRPRLTIRAHS